MPAKEEMPACPAAATAALIGSRRKLLILRDPGARPWRSNALKTALEAGPGEEAEHIMLAFGGEVRYD